MNQYQNVNNYNPTDSGKWGKATESALTGKRCKAQGKVDWKHLSQSYEIKTGAGQLDNIVRLKTRKILYIPVPELDTSGDIIPDRCEGFILSAPDFIDLLKSVGLFRESKVGTDGKARPAIQTFWNHSKGKPHSMKAYQRLMDALYETCEMTLEDLLNGEG